MTSFFKDIRRRSRASFRTSTSYHDSFQSNGRSSSTLNSSHDSHKTPPPSVIHDALTPSATTPSKIDTNGNSPIVSQRPAGPAPTNSHSARNSVVGAGSIVVNGSGRPPLPTSPYAPRVESISDNSWVHQKILLIQGQIGDTRQSSVDGVLSIFHAQDSFPPTTWPVRESYFKALVHLVPGPNRIRLEYNQPDPAHSAVHSSWININYLPLLNSPPLHLAIVLGRDSDGHFNSEPEPSLMGGYSLDLAIQKFRMAAYLWQAFTGEQMYRNNFGRRSFRFDEEWQPGTLSSRDSKTGQMRGEARVHIIRCEKTVAELQALASPGAASSNDTLSTVIINAVREHFNVQPGQTQYISALLLDSHNDQGCETILNQLGSSDGDIRVAISGSSCLHSYPSSLEEVVPSLTGSRRRQSHDSNLVNGNGTHNHSSSNWETAAMGMGAHLREIGRIFGCSPGENGIMNNDYTRINRTFTAWEPPGTRTKSLGLPLCMKDDEPCWSRLDALRFRFHPCFRLPNDAPAAEDSIHVWPVDNGKLIVTSTSGVAFAEIFVESDEMCKGHIEYVNVDAGNSGIPKQVTLTEHGIRYQLPEKSKKSKNLKVVIYSGGFRTIVVDDVRQLTSKSNTMKLPKSQTGFRSNPIRSSQLADSNPEEIILQPSSNQPKLLLSVVVYCETFITGIEFRYEDSTSQLFGRRATDPRGCEEFVLDTRRGELIMGFYVRFGECVEAIEIITSLGRKSGIFGSTTNGNRHTLIPPRGYSVAGISGWVGSYIDGFGLIITH